MRIAAVLPGAFSSSARARSLGRLARVRAIDALTLAAIAAVVLLVSLPRLRDFALHENESDALRLVARLSDALERARDSGAASPDVQRLLESSPAFARQLDDVEFLDGGRLLRRHGYVFALLDDAAPSGGSWIAAWPWKHGQTGRAAFGSGPGLGVVGHANGSGAWSGPSSPPPRPDPTWKRIAPPG